MTFFARFRHFYTILSILKPPNLQNSARNTKNSPFSKHRDARALARVKENSYFYYIYTICVYTDNVA